MNEKFKIFDNTIEHDKMCSIYDYVQSQPYSLWGRPNLLYMHKTLTVQNMNEIRFFADIKNDEIQEIVNGKKIVGGIINASFPGHYYYPHQHDSFALVYYVNLEWEDHWAGETIVYDDDKFHVCVPFVPGRILLIDKHINHALRPPTFAAPFYRFTISIFFE